MKISYILIFLIIIGSVFFAFTSLSTEMNINYGDKAGGNQINTSLWSGQYNYTEKINNSITPLIRDIKNIENEDAGWVSRIASGFVAIPHLILAFATLSIGSISSVGSVVTSLGDIMHIPPTIIYSIILVITVIVIIKLVSFFQKSGVDQ